MTTPKKPKTRTKAATTTTRPPGYVRCPMLACGRLHELPPDWE
ncbi:hypothetical protein ACFW5L_05110 [Streptomyces albidoflavus]